jgi:hypothetical protein
MSGLISSLSIKLTATISLTLLKVALNTINQIGYFRYIDDVKNNVLVLTKFIISGKIKFFKSR